MIINLESWETGYADGHLGRPYDCLPELDVASASAQVVLAVTGCARRLHGCGILCYQLKYPSGAIWAETRLCEKAGRPGPGMHCPAGGRGNRQRPQRAL
jgi:hypothetical protein